jgi:radical SAM protein with 4Fe4S-binding SPASM domain
VGKTQVAITPDGKLKMCLMIDYPKYNLLNSTLSREWRRLQELVNGITIDEDYQCRICELRLYCKWCPARSWLKARRFTQCDTFSRQRAQFTKDLIKNQ